MSLLVGFQKLPEASGFQVSKCEGPGLILNPKFQNVKAQDLSEFGSAIVRKPGLYLAGETSVSLLILCLDLRLGFSFVKSFMSF